jgi:hypothetical protein
MCMLPGSATVGAKTGLFVRLWKQGTKEGRSWSRLLLCFALEERESQRERERERERAATEGRKEGRDRNIDPLFLTRAAVTGLALASAATKERKRKRKRTKK